MSCPGTPIGPVQAGTALSLNDTIVLNGTTPNLSTYTATFAFNCGRLKNQSAIVTIDGAVLSTVIPASQMVPGEFRGQFTIIDGSGNPTPGPIFGFSVERNLNQC
jgi:hypothetical protein